MEDLYRAGGLLAVLRQVEDLLDPDGDHRHRPAARRATSARPRSGTARSSARAPSRSSRTPASPCCAATSRRPVRSSSRPPRRRTLLQHRGRAVVFDSIEDMHARIDDPDLDVDADSVLVLRGCGPRGYPGMPEVANMPLPKKLLEQGVRDMVRICDGRMSGTAYGTVVLHVAPEAAAGGRSAWSAPATSSSSTSRAGASTSTCPTRSSPRARRPTAATDGVRRADARLGAALRRQRACRPTPAPTSTSSSAPAATPSPASRTDPAVVCSGGCSGTHLSTRPGVAVGQWRLRRSWADWARRRFRS